MADFIVLEGIDGSGKSSVARYLKERHDDSIELMREPTDSEVGKLVQKAAHEDTSPYYDLFLYLADRVEHTNYIDKKIEDGIDVICDRYWGSTAAYQSASDEVELSYAESIQRPFIREPDLTVLLDIEPEESLERISGREKKSKYEKIKFLRSVRENYRKLAERHDWKIIDAGEDLEKVKEEVSKLLQDLK